MAFTTDFDESIMRCLARHARRHGLVDTDRGALRDFKDGRRGRARVDYASIAALAAAFAVSRRDEFDAYVAKALADIEAERARIAEHNRKARGGGGQ